MCGIIGIYNSNSPELDCRSASAMAGAIARRGPDAQGLRQLGNTVFAHRRLAIIDLDCQANQPMLDPSSQVMITFNGEIYNYRQLRNKLQQQGVVFRTSSDTEVILQLYCQGGSQALTQLDGMFALGIYDNRSRELLLMRDRLGKKPLYYFQHDNSFIFASTLQALKQHHLWSGELIPEAIEEFLAYEYIPGPGTVYKDVYQLPPATMLQIAPDGSQNIRQYWQLDYSNKLSVSISEAAEMLREKLISATAKRLIADVPCGIYLSGGVDSAITAMLAAGQSKEKLQAFTIGFNESIYDERIPAGVTAEFINQHSEFGIAHNCQVVNCRNFDILPQAVQTFGQPFADFSLLPCTLLSEFAASKVKLVLSGDGADELFGGYERYQAMRYCAQLDKLLPASLKRLLAFTAKNLLPDHGKRSRWSRLRRFLQLSAAPADQRYVQLMTLNTARFRNKLRGERLLDCQTHDNMQYLEQILQQATSPHSVERCAECDIHSYLLEDILVKVDRTSMANSLEVRSPFLDTEVVELAAQLPFEFKQYRRERKRILKLAVHDMIAPEIASGRKKGFAVPLAHYFRHEWKTLLTEHLLEGCLIKDNWLNPLTVCQLLNEHASCRYDHSELLGSLLMLELFLRGEKN